MTSEQELRKFIFKHNDTITIFSFLLLALTNIAFQESNETEQLIFRVINNLLQVVKLTQIFIQYFYLGVFYLNPTHYGKIFNIIDLICGPAAAFIDVYKLISLQTLIVKTHLFSDSLRLLQILTIQKLRIIIKDICYIIPKTKPILISILFAYYTFAYIGHMVFPKFLPQKYSNIFYSFLSIFQITTFDSWNIQFSLPITNHYSYLWGLFFVFQIFLLVYFYLNFFLSAFVTYYSNQKFRINFMVSEKDQQAILDQYQGIPPKNDFVTIRQVVDKLQLQHKVKRSLTQLLVANYKYCFIFGDILLELLSINMPESTKDAIQDIWHIIFGCLICLDFFSLLYQIFQSNQASSRGCPVSSEQVFVLTVLAIAGPIAFIQDIFRVVYIDFDSLHELSDVFRIMVLLTTKEMIYTLSKLIKILPKIFPLTILNVSLIYIFSLIGCYYLQNYDEKNKEFFVDVQQTMLFLFQTITFDAWGDIARSTIHYNVIFALFFAVIVIFVGFFLQNLLIGKITTETQFYTQELFDDNFRLDKKKRRQCQANLQLDANLLQKKQQLQQMFDQLNEDGQKTPISFTFNKESHQVNEIKNIKIVS